MSNHLGNNFNTEEKEFITIPFDGIDEFVDNAFSIETSGTATQEDLSSSSEEPSFTPGFISIGGDGDSNKEKTETKTRIPYRNPLRKIAGGRVLQYPIDLNTDLQD